MKSEAEKKLLNLKLEVEKCKRCELYKARTNAVFGVGPVTAKVMLVGEAAGFWEDQQGIPFVGAAGKNLNSLLNLAGLKREEVYITNVIKSRPPRNRAPTDEEIKVCRPYLEGQIYAIKPKLVIALGRIASGELLGRPAVISKEHGTLVDHSYAGVRFKLFVTYHPAASLYGAQAKLKLREDFLKLSKVLKSI